MTDRVLVLGASGFLGSAILSALGPDGVGTSRRADATFLQLNPDMTEELGDAIRRLGISVLVNAAGLRAGSDEQLEASNVTLTASVLEVAASHQVRLVHLGSAAEYGSLPGVVFESDTVTPLTPYGRSKLSATKLIMAAAQAGVDCVSARVFNVIGPGLPTDQPVGQFAAALQDARGSATITVRNAATCRDFVRRSFVASSVRQMCFTPGGLPPLVNLCSGRGVTFGSLVSAMAHQRGVEVAINDLHEPLAVPRVIGSTELFERRFAIPPGDANSLATLASEAFSDPA